MTDSPRTYSQGIEDAAKLIEFFCAGCQRKEKFQLPPKSSIVGRMAVHFPSGNICLPNTIRTLADDEALLDGKETRE
jgi:hypothetical protein